MKSIAQMIEQCEGLIDTKDVSAWENSFLKSIKNQAADGSNTPRLSDKQVEVLDRIYNKHFA